MFALRLVGMGGSVPPAVQNFQGEYNDILRVARQSLAVRESAFEGLQGRITKLDQDITAASAANDTQKKPSNSLRTGLASIQDRIPALFNYLSQAQTAHGLLSSSRILNERDVRELELQRKLPVASTPEIAMLNLEYLALDQAVKAHSLQKDFDERLDERARSLHSDLGIVERLCFVLPADLASEKENIVKDIGSLRVDLQTLEQTIQTIREAHDQVGFQPEQFAEISGPSLVVNADADYQPVRLPHGVPAGAVKYPIPPHLQKPAPEPDQKEPPQAPARKGFSLWKAVTVVGAAVRDTTSKYAGKAQRSVQKRSAAVVSGVAAAASSMKATVASAVSAKPKQQQPDPDDDFDLDAPDLHHAAQPYSAAFGPSNSSKSASDRRDDFGDL